MIANELRIGNWYLGDNGDNLYYKIEPEDIQDLFEDPLDDFYKPIPLTPELLEAAGFVNEEIADKRYGTHCYKICIRKSANRWLKLFKQGSWFALICENDNISTSASIGAMYNLHQLQNLYFALTNEELTITL